MGRGNGIRAQQEIPKGMMIYILKAIRDIGVPVDSFDIQAYLRKKSIGQTGQIGVALWRLEGDGYVSMTQREHCSSPGAPRKLYALTEKGELAVLKIMEFFAEV